jgi:TPR repeat protein
LPPAFDQKSIAAFKQQAASGNAAAQCGLGDLYDKGQGRLAQGELSPAIHATDHACRYSWYADLWTPF